MLFFLISCISFVTLSASFSLRALPKWANEIILLLGLILQEFVCTVLHRSIVFGISSIFRISSTTRMSFKKKSPSKVDNVELSEEFSILDLPELALECILERLPPVALCNMAGVCRSFRDRCRSNHLWERHMNEKWGRLMGPAAYREWQWCFASTRNPVVPDTGKPKGWIGSLSCMWPVSWLRSKMDMDNKPKSSLPANSIMSWYLSLESGKFWFPAQVYNREHGHDGFMLSCYDADLSYDNRTDTFHARYPPRGREDNVKWERLRAPPVDTPAHDLHVSDCWNDLQPGDHIEIQWRNSKDVPYGWWYGVVGHLELCNRNEHLCGCHRSADTVVVEFNQYTPGSRWRQTTINRKDHPEEGDDADGYYGGIRKLNSKEEILMWRKLWPTHILE